MHIEVSDPSGRRSRLRGLRLCALLTLCVWHVSAAAMDAAEAQQLLVRADSIKMGQPTEFDALLDRVDEHARALPSQQRDYLRYLRGYQASYLGEFDTAVPMLESLARDTADPTLKFRAAATIANVSIVSTHYEFAYAQLRPLLDLLPRVTDPAARQQGMAVAAYLYNQVGEYALALNYADRVIEENWGNGACRGAQLRVEALFRSGTARPSDPEFESSAAKCIASGEPLIASGIRIHHARLLADRGLVGEALQVLTKNYDAALKSRYPRVIAEFDAILAQAYLQKGDIARARDYALKTLDHGIKEAHTEPQVMAYHTLYQVARASDDERAALSYHEKFAAADKGYLDELSARQLAYERVKHEAQQDRMEADAASQQNELRQLQTQLNDKNREITLLYVALAITVLVTIAFWLWRSRRSR